MPNWICHIHQDISDWINARSRDGYAGVRASFDAACLHAEDDANWRCQTGAHAYVDYVPGTHPLAYPFTLKIRLDPINIMVVGVVMRRERLGHKVE